MSLYGDSHRALHAQFDSQRMAALLETMDTDEVQPQHKAFIESRDMFWLATVDSEGRPQCQYKGGAPGFIRVIDPKTVVFPSYDGNGRYHSMGNISATGQVGLLFLDFESPNRLRLQGEATLHSDAETLARWPGAELAVKIAVTQLFINCPRYVHCYRRVDASPYVPDAAGCAPLAKWKRIDALQDVLPARDSGRVGAAGGEITLEQYFAEAQAGRG